ncbi:hypothetical protein BN1723_018235, partial [Verticillium longisporum]
TIGISVDGRRQNLSEEGLAANVARLKAYQERLVLFPRKAGKAKKGDSTETDLSKIETASHIAKALPFAPVASGFSEIKKSEIPAAVEGGAFKALRHARSEKRNQGKREKRAKDKADAEAAAKK